MVPEIKIIVIRLTISTLVNGKLHEGNGAESGGNKCTAEYQKESSRFMVQE